ncbi:MAG: GvpL/GvpF family gas vesicle protein [Pseudomonadota bacterium]
MKNESSKKELEKTMGLYMYSVIQANGDRSFGPIGLSEDGKVGEEVYTITHEEIACVVSNSPIKEWDISRENTIKHQKVNEMVMKDYVTLPIKFCTIGETSEQIVEKFLRNRYQELRERIDYFADKEEYGVRALWVEMDKAYSTLLDENPRLKEWRDRLAKLPFDKARNDMIVLGQKVKETLQQKRKVLECELFDKLKPLAAEAKTNKLVGDRMVLNGAFLVGKESQTEFDVKVSELSEEYKDLFQLRYVGPTPPSNFIEIAVNWD